MVTDLQRALPDSDSLDLGWGPEIGILMTTPGDLDAHWRNTDKEWMCRNGSWDSGVGNGQWELLKPEYELDPSQEVGKLSKKSSKLQQ